MFLKPSPTFTMLYTENFTFPTDEPAVAHENLSAADSTNETLQRILVRENYACMAYASFIVNSLAAAVICVLGFAGNSMSFLILTRDKETPIASYLLQSLAAVDNVFLSSWFLHFSLADLFAHFRLVSAFHPTWWYIRVYTYPIIFVAQTATIWLTVLIALTRFLAVCVPYKAVTWSNLRNVKRGVQIVIVFSIIYNFPRFFESKVERQSKNGSVNYLPSRTAMGANSYYQLIYFDIMYYIFSFILPLLLMAVLNTKLTIAYRKVRLRRRESLQLRSERENNDHNITLVMIIVVLVFMLCNAPARIAQMIWQYNIRTCLSMEFWIIKFSNVLEVFNSSINFVIYCVFRRQFRQVVRARYCGSIPVANQQGLLAVQNYQNHNGSQKGLDTVCLKGHHDTADECTQV